MRIPSTLLFIIFSCVILTALPFSKAHALSFSFDVNTTSDVADVAVGDGTCGPPCSLRAALQELNSHAGASATIHLPAGTYSITLPDTLEISNSVTLNGDGATTTIIQRGLPNLSQVFRITTGGIIVTMTGVTITGGALAGDGGGIYNNGAALTLDQVAIKSNFIQGSKGAGIFNTGGGVLTITRSTLTDNKATDTSEGGALFNDGGTANITNTTIAVNLAPDGAGIKNNGGTITLTNCTLSNDTSFNGSANEIVNASGTVTLKNTIISNNPSSISNCSGTITSAGHNLDSGNTCGLTGSGDLINKDPLLALLQNNGGATSTMALQTGSPAINAGDNSGCPPTDQRAITRPQGSACDIGAFELEVAATSGGGSGSGGNGKSGCALQENISSQGNPMKTFIPFLAILVSFRMIQRVKSL